MAAGKNLQLQGYPATASYTQFLLAAPGPTPDAEKIVILSQNKHFPIWEAHWVTSSFWCRHHCPREVFIWKQEKEGICVQETQLS